MEHLEYASVGNQGVGAFGQFGLRVLTTDATAGEKFIAIQVLEDAVISSDLTSYKSGEFESIGDATITSLELTAGTIIYGRFENLEVASGKVIAYKG